MTGPTPRYPAAFINAIAEEGTKAEAVEWLQRTWNEFCEAKQDRAELMEALRALHNMYAATWDRVDGCLVMMGNGVERFENVHEQARALLARLEK